MAGMISRILGTAQPPMEDAARVRLKTLVTLRWIAVAGQLAALLAVHFGFGFDVPLVPAAGAVAASAALNFTLQFRSPAHRQLSDRQAALQLGFDLLQLAFLLYLTGGLTNPFALLILVPVTISATVLSRRSTILLLSLGLLLSLLLALWHQPLPWRGTPVEIPPIYLFGVWVGISLSMIFLSLYAARVSTESRGHALALAASEAALAREQKLSELGALAAAAAHELGTPLGTITLAARELQRDTDQADPRFEDIALINTQLARCREILQRLSERPLGEERHPFADQPFAALAREAARPFEALTDVAIVFDAASEPGCGGEQPVVRRRPEIIHALNNIVENAVGFARSQVLLEIRWSDDRAQISILDDGPGFDPNVLKGLGEPYMTTRGEPTAEPSGAAGEAGLGLGVFIAKTLLEKTGAEIAFLNRKEGGAAVHISWPRTALEAAEESPHHG